LQPIKAAKAEREPEVWDALESTGTPGTSTARLHRLGIQAADPILVEGKAMNCILVCTALMPTTATRWLYVPLSIEGQIEARVLMMSVNNILHLQRDRLSFLPRYGAGIYYLMKEKERRKGERAIYG
jgi:DNA-directed RNA polymerase subunit beta'